MSLRSVNSAPLRSPITQFELNYHPDYGLPTEMRVEVLRLVVVDKLPVKVAARLYRLHISTIYKWLADAGHPASKKVTEVTAHISNKDL